ncbi:DUF692 domain-containing protein [Sporichthya sp.]|uniref:DUF692 domain-containing protein n=1 Tax=Sporichthya sp. TaxID=65475 RepID=UPI0017966B7B|nr:DUF692 domain-containing protein [Sporichthya sp.]
MPELGIGIGWRSAIDLTIERMAGVDFVEVTAEHIDPAAVPASLRVLRERGVPAVVHAVTLSLGSAEPLDRARIAHLAAVATALDAPLVSDHVAFTHAGGLDTGHLLPVPRTRAALDVLVTNVREAQAELPVPLALENIACLLQWSDAELTEAQFLSELVGRTGCLLLIDVANLHANARNTGTDPAEFLATVPAEQVAYLHVAGGVEHDGIYHDTHAHPIAPPVLELLGRACEQLRPRGLLLEWDDRYGTDAEIAAEVAVIRRVRDLVQTT